MRRLLAVAAVLLLAVGGAGGLFVYESYRDFVGPGPLAEPVTLIVPKGAGVRQVARQLRDAGVLCEATGFLIAARFGEGGPLQAGEYAFPANVSGAAVLAMLRLGQTVVRRLTVPEGLTTAQVLLLLKDAEGLSGEVAEKPAEGELLPETYHYSYGDGRGEIVRRMRESMRRAVEELWPQRAGDLPLATPEQALVLASIVERETAVADERPRVAAVFINRLSNGMKLQSDPTVIYGLSNGLGVLDRALTREDLAAGHPYNTYVIPGLPPGPIANPGRASLAAVLRPAETDELYFVADGTGGHAFARTLKEHNRNVARWRKLQKQRPHPGPLPLSGGEGE